MKKVILYIRVSTDEQADKGYSQRSQEETLERFAALKEYQVIGKFFEDHSAKSFVRPTFSKLLMEVRKKQLKAELLLFTKWDRFSRNAGDAYQMIGMLNKLGVEPQAVEQPLDLTVPENKMMLAFYLAAPEVENDRRAMNVFAGMRRAKKEGRRMGQAMIGYSNKITEDGNKYIAPNETALLIKWAFETIASGKYTTESVWKKAQEKGLKCTKNTFWNALRNEGYCGLIKIPAYKNEAEELVKAQHDPIITKAMFYNVQDVLDGKKKLQRTKVSVDDRFPLRGYLQCNKCGKLLTASASRGKMGKYYSYYHCESRCGERYQADVVNDALVNELKKWKPNAAIKQLYKLIFEDVYNQQKAARSSTLTKIKLQIADAQERQHKALNMLVADKMDAEDYRFIKSQCEQSVYKLEQELATIATASNIEPLLDKAIAVLDNIDTMYSSSNTEAKRKIISSIFPEKMIFDGLQHRTQRVNEAVTLIFNVGKAFSEIKMGQIGGDFDLSRKVNKTALFSNLFIHDLKLIVLLAA